MTFQNINGSESFSLHVAIAQKPFQVEHVKVHVHANLDFLILQNNQKNAGLANVFIP